MEKKLSGEFNLINGNHSTPEEDSHNSRSGHKDKMHFFTSLAQFPDGISFAEQKNNEHIELFIRRHFVTNFPWIFLNILLILLPLGLPLVESTFPIQFPSLAVQSLYLFAYYLFIFGFVLLNFTLWYFHTGIVTNLRVIDVDVTGILIRIVSEAKNEDVQDVTHSQIGFVRSLFNYGDVLVQTAGSIQNIEFDRIPRPSNTAQLLSDLTHHK